LRKLACTRARGMAANQPDAHPSRAAAPGPNSAHYQTEEK
jgi:hypothetical protein